MGLQEGLTDDPQKVYDVDMLLRCRGILRGLVLVVAYQGTRPALYK